MYFFIQKSKELQSRAEQFGIYFQDVYVNAMQEIQEKYSLPSLHEWGDGYCQGDATNDEIFELVQNINKIDGGDKPTIYFDENDENDGEFVTDVYEYLDKKLIDRIEYNIESQIKIFGDYEFTQYQFDEYKEIAENNISEFLNNEYYSEENTIGHGYSVYFLADEMEVFDHVESSSNWSVQRGNDARFQILHLNNYDNTFNGFSDFVSENLFKNIKQLFNNDTSEFVEYFKNYVESNEEDFFIDEENFLDDVKEIYKICSFNERMEMWEKLDNESIIEDFNNSARSEVIDSFIDDIKWNEIEIWFNAQFEQF